MRRGEFDAVYRAGKRRSSSHFTVFFRANAIAAQPLRLQHQEGARRRGGAQSYPATCAGDRALPSSGDTSGMGHRHTSEEHRGEGGVCGADGGLAAAVAERAVSDWRACAERETQPQRRVPARDVRARCSRCVFTRPTCRFLFAGSCRFEPTCSHIRTKRSSASAWRAGLADLKRLLRCHPFSRKFGYDPVPEKWQRRGRRSECTRGTLAGLTAATTKRCIRERAGRRTSSRRRCGFWRRRCCPWA